MSRNEPYEEPAPARSLWGRVREHVFGPEEAYDTEEEGQPTHAVTRRANLRIDAARQVRVNVRLKAAVFNDARTAADGLKMGQQQIVNLESATPQMAERIIDFLNGVTYALDGSVEKIGDRVYLFAPANVEVELDGGADAL